MILVVGAAGKVGRHVVSELLSAGAAVRALVRGSVVLETLAGAQVVTADLLEPASLTAALDGVEAVSLIWPLADATAAASLVPVLADGRRVVYLSTVGVRDDLARQVHPLSEMHAQVEQQVKSHAREWTLLRATKFATNTLAWADTIRRENVVEGTYGDARRSPVHQRDIAAVVARVLLETGHGGQTYVVSGPELLSEREQAAALASVLDRPIEWREVPPDEARARMIATGTSAELADAALAYWKRLVDVPEPVTDTVARVTGVAARTFRQWARENVAQFR